MHHESVSLRPLTQVIPNLAIEGNREAWFKLEAAKRVGVS
jgi:hypothetical protein